MRFVAVTFSAFDDRVEDGAPAAGVLSADEQPVLLTDRGGSDG